MLEKVFYTSVLVSDQDKALDFYTNVLGLEKRVENPTPDGPRFLTVGVEGDDFQLVLWPGTPGRPSRGWEAAWWMSFSRVGLDPVVALLEVRR
jgi:catechol 2,3-dioxygenase-like lactoylglutathione lyase family enzyme